MKVLDMTNGLHSVERMEQPRLSPDLSLVAGMSGFFFYSSGLLTMNPTSFVCCKMTAISRGGISMSRDKSRDNGSRLDRRRMRVLHPVEALPKTFRWVRRIYYSRRESIDDKIRQSLKQDAGTTDEKTTIQFKLTRRRK